MGGTVSRERFEAATVEGQESEKLILTRRPGREPGDRDVFCVWTTIERPDLRCVVLSPGDVERLRKWLTEP
jgi:hypothetical protein